MISREQAENFANTWVDAWNRHDLEAILVHYADEVEWSSPFIVQVLGERSGTIRGKVAVRTYLERGLARYPDLTFTLVKVLLGVDTFTLYYRSVNDLLAAEVFDLAPPGRARRILCHYADPS